MIIGGYLRIADIGRYTFWTDEFFHVFSAKSLLETGSPALPSGIPYTRSMAYTYIVSLFFKVFGVNEAAARMPSVIFGLAMIVVTYFMVSRILSRNAGIISAFLVAVSPVFIVWSVQCRIYTLFFSLYLFCIFYFYYVFERMAKDDTTLLSRDTIMKYLIFSAVFIFSFSVHELSLFLVPSVLAYCAVMAVFPLFQEGLPAFFRSKYFKLAVLIAIAAAAMMLFNVMGAKGLLLDFSKNPLVSRENDTPNINFYRELIQRIYPTFYYFFPLALFILILKKRREGIFLGCAFLAPLLVLSYMFAYRGLRYLVFILPFLLITVSYIIEQVFLYLWQLSRDSARQWRATGRVKKYAPAALFSFSCLLALMPILLPWMRMSLADVADFGLHNFSACAEFVKKIDRKDIVISTEPFLIEYYAGRKPGFIILTRRHTAAFPRYYDLKDKEGNSVDFNAGIRAIRDLEELKSAEKRAARVWIVTNLYFLLPDPRDREIIDYIKKTYALHPVSKDPFDVYWKKGKEQEGGND